MSQKFNGSNELYNALADRNTEAILYNLMAEGKCPYDFGQTATYVAKRLAELGFGIWSDHDLDGG